MRSLSSIGLGLSIVFGCLLLALIAELYYLLWWKKRFTNREIQQHYSSPAREFLHIFCWKKPSALSSTVLATDTQVHEPQAQLHQHKDLWLKPFGEDDGIEAELLRLQSHSRPQRFLFTIKEETKEDLESEDNKSRKGSRGRSLSDLVITVETPFLTPLSSPPYYTPPLSPMNLSYNHKKGFNPLFQFSSDAEFNRVKSSPPPIFKFLRDAEDKLGRKQMMETFDFGGSVEDDGVEFPTSSRILKDEENGSFIRVIVPKKREREVDDNQHNIPQYPSSSSQVLPLAASPSTFRPHYKKNPSSL